jgi:putative membrane protein
MRFLIRLVVTAVALWVAVKFVPGLHWSGPLVGLLEVAIVFGLLNAIVRPLLAMLTCPLVVLTLGLFLLVLNGLMLWLTALLSGRLGLGFAVDGFVPAFIGALVVSVTSAILNLVVADPSERDD